MANNRCQQFIDINQSMSSDLNKYNFINKKDYELLEMINKIKQTIDNYLIIKENSVAFINFKNNLFHLFVDLHFVTAYLYIYNTCNININDINGDNINVFHENCAQLFKSKNDKYGDAFATYGVVGIIVRVGDKISRINKMYETVQEVQDTSIKTDNESINDTLIDLSNYCSMAAMLIN